MTQLKKLYLILFTFLSCSGIIAQDVSTLQNSLDTAQSPAQKLDLLVEIAQNYADKGDLQSALEYCAKAIQFDNSARGYDPFDRNGLYYSTIGYCLKNNSSIDSLELMVNSLEKNIITPDFLMWLTWEIKEYKQSNNFAFKLAQEALNLSNTPMQQADAHKLMGGLIKDKQRSLESVPHFLEAKTLYYELKDTLDLIHTIKSLIAIYMIHYEIDKAEQEIQEGIALAEAYKDEVLLIRIKRKLGALYRRKGNYKDALQHANSLYDKARKIKSKKWIAYLNDDLFMIYDQLGKYQKAKEFLKKSIDYDVEHEAFSFLPRGYNFYGDCFYALGVYDSAAIYYHKSIQFAIDYEDNYNLYYSLIDLYELNNLIGDTTTARKYSELISDYFENLELKNNKPLQRRWYNWKAIQAENTHQLDSAIFYSKKRLNLEQIHVYDNFKFNLANLYQKSGDLVNSKQQLFDILKKAKEMGATHDQSESLYHLADIALAEGELAIGLNYAHQSLDLAEQFGHGESLESIYKVLTKLHAAKQNYKEAFLFQAKLDSLQTSRYGFVQKDQIAKYEAK